MDPIEQLHHLFRDSSDVVAFEIFYYDGHRVIGRTLEDWKSLPSMGVQIVIWERGKHRAHEVVHGLDYYSLGASMKLGSWIRRKLFLAMLDSVDVESRLLNV